ncbi:MAG: GNAT family N-acetyltransferase [Methylomarinum sp.]|nr:GNAT family N-acetyltransferase [Methylomarinum sp.]
MDAEIEEVSPGFEFGFTLILKDQNHSFGRAHVIFNGDNTATLADIYIEDVDYIPYPWVKFYKKKIQYTRKGHGTYLLKEVIARCKSKGITKITGDLHGDPQVLIPWYQNNGFEVVGGKKILYKFASNNNQ